MEFLGGVLFTCLVAFIVKKYLDSKERKQNREISPGAGGGGNDERPRTYER